MENNISIEEVQRLLGQVSIQHYLTARQLEAALEQLRKLQKENVELKAKIEGLGGKVEGK